jgi:hypothetical protein
LLGADCRRESSCPARSASSSNIPHRYQAFIIMHHASDIKPCLGFPASFALLHKAICIKSLEYPRPQPAIHRDTVARGSRQDTAKRIVFTFSTPS